MMDRENEGVQIVYSAEPDVNENIILNADPELLSLLLSDYSTEKNILWMTENYLPLGAGYEEASEITILHITGSNAIVSLFLGRINGVCGHCI